MAKPNPNQALIDEAAAFAERIDKLTPRDGNIAVSHGAALTIRDNLRWHGESTLEREAKAEAEKAEKAKAPANPKPETRNA